MMFIERPDGVNPKIRASLAVLSLGLILLTFIRFGIEGPYLQLQENPLEIIKYAIMGVAYAFSQSNVIGMVISHVLGVLLFGHYYVSLANKYARNPTWAFFYSLFFGVIAGFFYIPYLWIVSMKKESK